MKKIVYVLIGILLLFGCNSPEKLPEPFQGIFTDTDAEIFFEYNSITSDRLTNFFVDNFDNNNSEWYTGFNANLAGASVSNGEYFLKAGFAGNSFISYSGTFVNWDTNKNFQIEYAMRSILNNENSGIVWGYSPNPQRFFYMFEYLIGKYDNQYTEWYNSNPMNLTPGAYNKFTIRKYNNKYYFYINENIVHTQNFEPLFEKRIGFFVASYSEVGFDYIRIKYIN